MKIVTLRLMQNFVGGWLCLMAVPQVLALPIVESRTGDPVVRSSRDVGSSVTIPGDSTYTSPRPQSIDALKEELNSLRGSMEEKDHQLEAQIDRLKKSQQDFYVDLDKRLTQLESSKSTVSKALALPPAKTVASLPVKPLAVPTAEVPVDEEDALAHETEDASTPVATIAKKSGTTAAASTMKPAATQTHTGLAEKAIYEAASASLSAQQYSEAIEGFQRCVARFPQGSYAAQCYYWLGESYMAQWGSHKDDKTLLDKASQSFLIVTTRFPTHQRATDALLKLGMVEQEKGNVDVSKRYFEQVRDRYPDSAAARIAESHLQED
ncbi:MAG: tol-pal system protein YbgF [Gammaproteobacteria bacterium]|nr:tol-pal system protein YbgF [Gammaproteobacteria bacterium]MBP9728857.1 tol-pal system protein YbgF [Gammaproteobacteria bacterium]